MHITIPQPLDEMLAEAKLPLSERLLKQAEAKDREAESLRHCMWAGDRHPMSGPQEEAQALRQAALVARAEEARKARRRKPKPA